VRTWIVLAGLVLLAAAPASAGQVPTPRIVGGAPAPLSAHPWQVAILYGTPGNRQFLCGGAILDATHVLTAAHCLVNGAGAPEPASKVWVLAGVTDLALPPLPDEQLIGAASVAPMDEYGSLLAEDAYDAGLITLQTPLERGPAVQPAVLTAPGQAVPAATPLTVSGWGATDPDGLQYDSELRAVTIAAVSDPACAAEYEEAFDAATMLCAIDAGKDACFGDSGGPLTREDRTLVGLVSWGPQTCGGQDGPGVYTELAEPEINAFARFGGYSPPQNAPGSPPVISGVPQTGEPLTCAPGSWTGAPDFDYRFEQDGPLREVARDWGASPQYTPSGADVTRRLRCLVRARSDSGAAVATSAATAAVAPVGPSLTSVAASPEVAGLGQDVQLTASASDPDSAQAELDFTWDVDGDGFDDGAGAAVTTSFATPGTRTVRVRVADEGGRSAVGQTSVEVLPAVAPRITAFDVPAAVERLRQATFTVTVTAGTTPADELRFLWDLDGDGAYDDAATGDTPSITTLIEGPTGPRTVGVQVLDRTQPSPLRDEARRTLDVLGPLAEPAPAASATQAAPDLPAGDTTPPALRLSAIRRSGSGARVTVSCGGEPCTGTLTLRTAAKVRTGSARRVLVIGRAPFRLSGGARAIQVRLSAGARRLLRRGALRIVVSAEARDAAGNRARRTAKATLRRR
jgi:secreted trypsin-like serine protease